MSVVVVLRVDLNEIITGTNAGNHFNHISLKVEYDMITLLK